MIMKGCCEKEVLVFSKNHRWLWKAVANLCCALEQKDLILLKIHERFKKAVVNQIDEKEDTIKQIAANMVLTPV